MLILSFTIGWNIWAANQNAWKWAKHKFKQKNLIGMDSWLAYKNQVWQFLNGLV